MLSAAALGLAGYGLWSAASAAIDLLGPRALEISADLTTLLLGLVLMLATALVRVRMPGGLALALGALLGLQALALHASAHLHGEVQVVPQLGRAAFAVLLIALAWLGGRHE